MAITRVVAVVFWFVTSLLASTMASAIGPTLDDTPLLVAYPALPRPSDEVLVEGRPSLPYRQDQTFIYVRAPEVGGQAEVRLIPADKFHFYPDYFVASLGTPATEGRYFVEDYTAPFTPGAEPVATFEFSVSSADLLTVVEYFNPALDRYFMTSRADEIAALDNGGIPGWQRTGGSFHALPTEGMPSNANPVCRLYGLPEAGLNSHFYSDNPGECANVLARWPGQWVEETAQAFGVVHGYPYSEYDNCADDDPYNLYTPLYRLFSNRVGGDHRYTTSPAARDQMLAKGWVLEGDYSAPNSMVYAMCVLR